MFSDRQVVARLALASATGHFYYVLALASFRHFSFIQLSNKNS